MIIMLGLGLRVYMLTNNASSHNARVHAKVVCSPYEKLYTYEKIYTFWSLEKRQFTLSPNTILYIKQKKSIALMCPRLNEVIFI